MKEHKHNWSGQENVNYHRPENTKKIIINKIKTIIQD